MDRKKKKVISLGAINDPEAVKKFMGHVFADGRDVARAVLRSPGAPPMIIPLRRPDKFCRGDKITREIRESYPDYEALLEEKRGKKQICASCGERWNLGNTGICMACGKAYGLCCMRDENGDFRRCDCGGDVD